jgi:hypothetical protein
VSANINVESHTAIAGKPAPTGNDVHLQETGRLSGRQREQAHSYIKQIGAELLLLTTHQAER